MVRIDMSSLGRLIRASAIAAFRPAMAIIMLRSLRESFRSEGALEVGVSLKIATPVARACAVTPISLAIVLKMVLSALQVIPESILNVGVSVEVAVPVAFDNKS
jgi:hypothetical protein